MNFLLKMLGFHPSAEHNQAIRSASANGHLEVVRLLLTDKRTDPSVSHNSAIRSASANGHLEVVRLLLTDKRVIDKLKKNNLKLIDLKKYKLKKI